MDAQIACDAKELTRPEEADIGQLVSLFGTELFRFCRSLTTTRQDAEDLYQQTFLKAFDLRHKIDATKNPRGFLYTIAKNLWRNDLRKRIRHQRIAPALAFSELDGELIADLCDTANTAEQKEMRQAVVSCVAALSEKLRIAVLLYYGQNLSIHEIGVICGCSDGTVKSRLARARANLHTELEAMGYDTLEE